jgi:hemerythrin superfamily protein
MFNVVRGTRVQPAPEQGAVVVSADVVDLIMQDHREVERLFDEMRSHPEKRPLMVPTLGALLTAHSRAEEAEVYPVAKEEAGEAEEVAHSQEEHAQAEELLRRLAEANPDSSKFDEILDGLVEAVKHHGEEEESTVLAGMRERLDEDRLAELGAAFAASRAEHLGDRPGDASREELLAQARNAGISGASSMSKQELVDALADLRPRATR